ncbi:hypothetical protein KUCAC02_018351 [Chaenocephalus aceratus]|uniref:Uncharacterized protein n=1 Tax=Chaenocephalus aceratus TaxID=36190 RepID=A0ACB9W899_CHAAC|nr:hypothetical protein KUCAC02_018351 [Chaenocephalus aceratus]
MGNGINKVLPDLYLGNFKDARDREQLARNNITHILSIHDSAAPILQEMTYLCISAADLPTQNLTQHFKQSIMFMHESRLKGEGCLVHCLAGVSRSVTLVVAYIMTVTGLGWQEALAAVKVVRPCAGPNRGFQHQLQEFEATQAKQFREWLQKEYKDNPFNDEADLRELLAKMTKADEMNLDEDSGLTVSCGNGKQDYNRDEDAALFKAWALFKGKYKEGVDKPDPPTWKTRLRCALNKSNDFDELVQRSQLDITDPYKVYRIIPEAAKRGMKMSMEETPSHANSHGYVPPYTSPQNQVSGYMVSQERRDWRDYSPPEQQPLPPPHHHGPHAELQYGSSHYPSAFSRAWPGSHTENVFFCLYCTGFQLSFHTYLSESQLPVYSFDQSNAITDFSLHVSLYYRESMVKEVTTTSPEGCRITSSSSSSPSSSSSSSSSSEDKLHSGAETILFPFPYPESQRQGADMLPIVLEKGVLLWMTADGLYADRLCQGRVYWEGPMAPYMDKPNKLEKEQPCKLFDTQQFLIELQDFVHNGRHVPRYQVVLCFGDEYPRPTAPEEDDHSTGGASVCQKTVRRMRFEGWGDEGSEGRLRQEVLAQVHRKNGP